MASLVGEVTCKICEVQGIVGALGGDTLLAFGGVGRAGERFTVG